MDINYKDFKILKRGESGWGGLIEHDAGYISPDEPTRISLAFGSY